MKSSQFIKKSPSFTASHPRLNKGIAALFAGALALGLGVGSVMAQGPYYPQVNGAAGSIPFNFNGVPITSSPEFSLIESNMPATATIKSPPPVGSHTATTAEYNAAVQAAGQVVAAGGAPGVTVGSLAACVATYRTAIPGATQLALGALARGVIAANTGTVVAQLGQLTFSAAQANPVGLAGPLLSDAFAAAGNSSNVAIFNSVGTLASQALAGAAAGTPSGTGLPSTSVSVLVANAATAVVNGTGGLTDVQKKAALQLVVGNVSSSPTVAGSLVNLDAATKSLVSGTNTTIGGYGLTTMLSDIKAGSGAATDAKLGAIAQGALRNFNTGFYAQIITGLGGGTYVTNLATAYSQFKDTITPASSAGTVANTYGPVETAAAAATFFDQANTNTAVVSILDYALWPLVKQTGLIGAAVSANQLADITIATSSVGHGTVTRGDITYVATLNARVNSAGKIAYGIVQVPGVTVADAGSVALNAIKGAADAAPLANKTNAFADIAYNLGNALAADLPATNAAVTNIVNQTILSTTGVPLTAPTYIGVVAAMAGAPAGNRATILATGLAANGGDDDSAINAGAGMVNAATTNTYGNYNETLTRISIANSTPQNLAVLYAANLVNSGDAAGGLAVAIAKTPISVGDLTRAAVSAAAAVSGNRDSQAALSIAADVSVHTKTNPNDIQAYLGRQIITNPTAVKEITTAATVNAPQFSHTIAHTLAFNAPTTAWDSVNGIFLHSKITSLNAGANFVNDRPAAGAAITAALTTGILENTQLSVTDTRLALQNMITRSVTALHGGIGYSYTDATPGPATFRQSDGSIGGFTLVKSKGVAGGITGFMAQVVKAGDTDITGGAAGPVFNALFQAAYAARQLTGTLYMLDMAQAAGQAFGWVSGQPNSGAGATAATNIAQAIFNAGSGTPLASIRNAVDFGINEAAGGVIVNNPARLPGAGAAGLRDVLLNALAPYYDHHSAQGIPVSNIFNL